MGITFVFYSIHLHFVNTENICCVIIPISESFEDCTQEYEIKDSDIGQPDTSLKRPISPVDSEPIPAKRHCDERSPAMTTSICTLPKCIADAISTASNSPGTSTSTDTTSIINSGKKTPTPPGIRIAINTSTAADSIPVADKETTAPCGIGTATDNHAVDYPSGVSSVASASGVAESNATPSYAGMADTLVCSICQDIFHDCIRYNWRNFYFGGYF